MATETARAPGTSTWKRLLARALPWTVALAVAIGFGLSFGLNYGVDNQTAYMLGALRMVDGTILHKDWYASGPVNYHPAFSYVGALLLAFDRGGWGVGVGLVVVAAVGALFLHGLMRALFDDPRRALAAYLLLMAVAFASRTHGVAASYIFDFILQPSTLGSLFLLGAFAPFVSGRFLLSGIMLGLSGLFHANFLVLGIATFGLTHLFLGWRDGWKPLALRLAQQLGPSFLALALLSPLILRSAASPADVQAQAQDLLFNVRSPHHYAPKNFKSHFWPVAAWLMVGIGASGYLRGAVKSTVSRLGALVTAMTIVVWGGTLFTAVFNVPKVSQLFVFRYAPFEDLLMQVLLAGAVVTVALRPVLLVRVPLPNLALILGGLVSLVMADGLEGKSGEAGALALTVAAIALLIWAGGQLAARVRPGAVERARGPLRAHGVWGVLLGAAVICSAIGWPYVESYRSRSNLFGKLAGPETDMYTWIRANTAKDAVFLTPPSLERFRLAGERAIVVDWKGSAYKPDELVEWYHRLENVSGAKGFRRTDKLNEGYAALDDARLASLKQTYGLAYAVVAKGREAGLTGKVVFSNSRFTVLELAP